MAAAGWRAPGGCGRCGVCKECLCVEAKGKPVKPVKPAAKAKDKAVAANSKPTAVDRKAAREQDTPQVVVLAATGTAAAQPRKGKLRSKVFGRATEDARRINLTTYPPLLPPLASERS